MDDPCYPSRARGARLPSEDRSARGIPRSVRRRPARVDGLRRPEIRRRRHRSRGTRCGRPSAISRWPAARRTRARCSSRRRATRWTRIPIATRRSSTRFAAASRWSPSCAARRRGRGWVRVSCFSDAMAGWLLRAIVMENVSARAEGLALDLPASPHFRVEKEIKNVVTVAAKTCHYWLGHMPRTQKQTIAVLFDAMARRPRSSSPSGRTRRPRRSARGSRRRLRRQCSARRGFPARHIATAAGWASNVRTCAPPSGSCARS